MKFNLKLVFLVLLATLMPISVNATTSQENTKLENELEAVNLQMDYMKLKVRDTRKKARKLTKRIKKKKASIKLLQKQFKKLSENKQIINTSLLEINKKVNISKNTIKSILVRFRSNLVNLHKIKQNTLISSVFSAKTLNSFLNRYQMVKYLLKNDKELISKIKHENEELTKQLNAANKINTKFQRLTKQLEEKEQKLKIGNKSLNAMLATLLIEKKIFLLKEKKLKKARTQLNDEIAKIEAERLKNGNKLDKELIATKDHIKPVDVTKEVKNGKGANVMQFVWPVDKKFISKFDVSHPGNKAIKIYLNKEAEVIAIARGKILYKGTLGTLGSVIVIGHKRGFSSVYAGVTDIWTGIGQIVEQGETVGKFYSALNKPLHFEIRFGGKKKSPLDYLPTIK